MDKEKRTCIIHKQRNRYVVRAVLTKNILPVEMTGINYKKSFVAEKQYICRKT